MREKIENSEYCELRTGCEVISRVQTEDGVAVTYRTMDGVETVIKTSWLIGADGKKGVVRKHFLQPEADIRQVEATYRYEGLWIASNLRLSIPTPKTHPDFPLWKLGYTPEQVYDLFWPRSFHFASPPGKPTASGRFGPHEDLLWRHEFAQHDWHDGMDPEALLWEHITPMITRGGDKDSTDKNRYHAWPCGNVTYPRDCIEVMRCRPFRFAHKVVNRWFDGRTMLIGDAAHVFPPFGGQGIACGMADAHQLAWRLFLLQRMPGVDCALSDKMLSMWSTERGRGVRDAARMTQFNGQLCNVGDSFGFWFFRNLAWLSRIIPFVPTIQHPFTVAEKRGLGQLDNAFFLPKFSGGGRVAQIPVESGRQMPVMSDSLLRTSQTILTLLVLGDNAADITKRVGEAKKALRLTGVHDTIVSVASIRVLSRTGPVTAGDIEVFHSTTLEHIVDLPTKPCASSSVLLDRFASSTKFSLVRNDFYIFAQAKSFQELVVCLREVVSMTYRSIIS